MSTSFAELESPTAPTLIALRLGRHAVGIIAVAAANPFVWMRDGLILWVSTWLGVLLLSAVGYGLYALFFTRRAKAAWPKSFIILAWVLLGLTLAGQWLTYNNARSARANARAAAEAAAVTPAPQQPSLQFDPSTARKEQ